MVTRPLRRADVPDVTALIHSFGWGQTSTDIEGCLDSTETQTLGEFDTATNQLLSMAVLQVFTRRSTSDTGYGWLSYVATAPHARRRGLASALITTLLSTAPQNVPIGLYGSPDGAPLYAARFGFVDRGHANLVELSTDALRAIQCPTAPSGCALVPAAEVMSAIIALDELTSGVDRSAALARWAATTPEACWALRSDADGGEVVGFVLCRPLHPSGVFIGPLTCRNDAEAEALLRAALSSVPRETPLAQMLTVDVWGGEGALPGPPTGDEAPGEALELATGRLGFARLGAVPSRLMVHGTRPPVPWVERAARARREGATRPFAAAGFEFG